MKEEEFLQPHIGKLVQGVLKKIGMKNIVFGQRMNLKSSGTSLLLKRADWYVSQVADASRATVLQHHNGHSSLSETQKYIGEMHWRDLEFLRHQIPQMGKLK